MPTLPFRQVLGRDPEPATDLVGVQAAALNLAVDQGAGEASLLGCHGRRKVRGHLNTEETVIGDVVAGLLRERP